MDADTDHTHKGEHSCVRKRVCVTQDISSRKRTMGRLKQRKKKEFILLGIAQQGGERAELSGSYHWGWRALSVYWEVPTMKVRRLDVLESSVSVPLHTPHASHPTSNPPRFHFRVKSRREAVSQNTKVQPLLLFSAAAFPPCQH